MEYLKKLNFPKYTISKAMADINWYMDCFEDSFDTTEWYPDIVVVETPDDFDGDEYVYLIKVKDKNHDTYWAVASVSYDDNCIRHIEIDLPKEALIEEAFSEEEWDFLLELKDQIESSENGVSTDFEYIDEEPGKPELFESIMEKIPQVYEYNFLSDRDITISFVTRFKEEE